MTESTYLIEGINPLEFYGVNNSRFKHLQNAFPDVNFMARGNELRMKGPQTDLSRLTGILDHITKEIKSTGTISDIRFSEVFLPNMDEHNQVIKENDDIILYGPHGNIIRAKTQGMKKMYAASKVNDVMFAIGPAGTGKTYTAVAIAVEALKEKHVKKIVLARPAVETGESLGFLPGDLKEKIDPYLRPLYDALEDMLPMEKLKTYIDKNIIEIAPLAYMRGRTLNNAFIILDEAQNATEMQIKMFLTRLGQHSKVIITGDETQIDLPKHQRSGLLQGMEILQKIEGITFITLNASDVVRHKLVKDILAAYEKMEAAKK